MWTSRARGGGWGWFLDRVVFGRIVRGRNELARLLDALVAAAVGEQSVVADLDEPTRQDVQAEAAQQLVEGKGHGLALVVVGVVLVGEGDGAGVFVDLEDAPIADGDAVRVARQVSEHLGGTAEGALGIHVPLRPAGFAHEARERGAVAVDGHLAVELEFALVVERLESVAVFTAEDQRKSPHSEEVVGLESAPTPAVGGKSPAGDDAMQVVMVEEVLAPRVQDGGDARTHGELVAGELHERGAGRFEEQAVHGAGVLRDESVERVRQREDDVEVRHRQQVFFLPVEPLVGVGALAARTMPVAATVRHHMVAAAVGAAVTVRAERRRAAAQDRVERFPNVGAQGRRLPQGGGDHLRHRRCSGFGAPGRGAHDRASAGVVEDLVQRTAHRLKLPPADMQVGRRGREVRVPQQHLQAQQIDAVLQEMRGKAVPQRVDTSAVGQPCPHQRAVEDALRRAIDHRHIRAAPRREQPHPGPLPAVVAAQLFEQPRTQNRVTVLAAFALLDPQHHAPALDVLHLQVARFVQAQPGSVDGHQKRALCRRAASVGKQLLQLLARVDSRTPRHPRAARQQLFEIFHRPLEHLPVKQPQRADRHVDRAEAQPPMVQPDQVTADLLVAQRRRRAFIRPGQGGNRRNMGLVCSLRIPAKGQQPDVLFP